jgi:hypothetical protein
LDGTVPVVDEASEALAIGGGSDELEASLA